MPFFKRKPKESEYLQDPDKPTRLSDWWKTTFTRDEQDYIFSKGIPLDAIIEPSSSPARSFHSLAGYFSTSPDRTIARRFLDKVEESLKTDEVRVLDRHFAYSSMIPIYYSDRDTDPEALGLAIHACQRQIALAIQARAQWTAESPTPDSPLPSHRGFTQLAIIREKEGNYTESIKLSQDSQRQGSDGDWEKRITRCEKRMSKS